MILTIDEAIKHCEEVAEKNEEECKNWAYGASQINDDENRKKQYQKHAEMWHKCASEHRQLAEWLRELKKYRIAHWKLRDMDYEYDFNSMFGDNPMYYGEKVWDLFGDIDASVEYEVMGYEEVNADGKK